MISTTIVNIASTTTGKSDSVVLNNNILVRHEMSRSALSSPVLLSLVVLALEVR